jgi:hypothetical protein
MHRHRHFIGAVWLLAGLAWGLAAAGPAAAQGAGPAKQTLTADGEWVLRRWEVAMGETARCTSGLSYVFKSNGVLVERQCVASKLRVKESTWRVVEGAKGELTLFRGAKRERLQIVGADEVKLAVTNDKGDLVREATLVFEPR